MNQNYKKSINYVIDIGQAISFLFVFITGVLKFDGITSKLNLDMSTMPMKEFNFIHDWSGIIMGVLVLVHIVLHLKWMWYVTLAFVKSKKIKTRIAVILVASIIISLVSYSVLYIKSGMDTKKDKSTAAISNETPKFTEATLKNTIEIENIGRFDFLPKDIKSIRADIYNIGYFTAFDILVYLNNIGKIEMEYHFENSMNTNVIDSINGIKNWWYLAHYDGGQFEYNNERMDNYLYKDKTEIKLYQIPEPELKQKYSIFAIETKRKADNGGKTIIPMVDITDDNGSKKTFKNVEVKAFNMRNDVFKEGVITSLDVILSLQAQGQITCDLQWYESIGSADVVKNYWINGINGLQSEGRSGFLYSHIERKVRITNVKAVHIPSDIRVLHCTELIRWNWATL